MRMSPGVVAWGKLGRKGDSTMGAAPRRVGLDRPRRSRETRQRTGHPLRMGGWFDSCSRGSPLSRAVGLFSSVLVAFGVLAAVSVVILPSAVALAEGPVPPATDLPSVLSLDEALQIFHAHGLDLLIAEAAVRSAEGDVKVAGAGPDPVVNARYGRA